jgi:putative phosphoesterase
MRIAVVSDIHGNRTAFEAVLADLRETSADLVLHGGDLADFGSGPAEIVDAIRDLGWPGVVGNTDEMLFEPDSLREVSRRSPGQHALFSAIEDLAASAREALGEERLAWLSKLPRIQTPGQVALVHASPESPWRAPAPNADDAELESTYGPLGRPIAVYAHLHWPFVRELSRMVVVNTGSVGMPYDGDPRAAYLLIDGSRPEIRRVEYDVDGEIDALSRRGTPHADWIARILRRARFEMP